MNGQISIVRPGACDDREIRLIIRLAMGKTITALITPENLALALTGKSDLPVELKLRNVEIKVKIAMTTITKERIELFIKNPLDNGLTRGEQMELARIALASLERELIRHEHAKWSDSTFGCIGPIGPLKHLSKEALEAAAEPDDLSEWADMQFLLWDAQRRAGISDAEITAAMEDKLKINMERQWPEPKDGEPRLHIKEPGNYPVTPDGWISCSERMPEMGERQCYVLAADFKNNYPPNIPNTQVGVYGDWFNDGNPTWDDGDGEDLYLKEVTHWMPLPEPPRLKEL